MGSKEIGCSHEFSVPHWWRRSTVNRVTGWPEIRELGYCNLELTFQTAMWSRFYTATKKHRVASGQRSMSIEHDIVRPSQQPLPVHLQEQVDCHRELEDRGSPRHARLHPLHTSAGLDLVLQNQRGKLVWLCCHSRGGVPLDWKRILLYVEEPLGSRKDEAHKMVGVQTKCPQQSR